MPKSNSKAASSQSAQAKGKSKITRTRSGCWTCRRRGYKCDEAKPFCDNCARLNLTCEGYAIRLKWQEDRHASIARQAFNTINSNGQDRSDSSPSPPKEGADSSSSTSSGIGSIPQAMSMTSIDAPHHQQVQVVQQQPQPQLFASSSYPPPVDSSAASTHQDGAIIYDQNITDWSAGMQNQPDIPFAFSYTEGMNPSVLDKPSLPYVAVAKDDYDVFASQSTTSLQGRFPPFSPAREQSKQKTSSHHRANSSNAILTGASTASTNRMYYPAVSSPPDGRPSELRMNGSNIDSISLPPPIVLRPSTPPSESGKFERTMDNMLDISTLKSLSDKESNLIQYFSDVAAMSMIGVQPIPALFFDNILWLNMEKYRPLKLAVCALSSCHLARDHPEYSDLSRHYFSQSVELLNYDTSQETETMQILTMYMYGIINLTENDLHYHNHHMSSVLTFANVHSLWEKGFYDRQLKDIMSHIAIHDIVASHTRGQRLANLRIYRRYLSNIDSSSGFIYTFGPLYLLLAEIDELAALSSPDSRFQPVPFACWPFALAQKRQEIEGKLKALMLSAGEEDSDVLKAVRVFKIALNFYFMLKLDGSMFTVQYDSSPVIKLVAEALSLLKRLDSVDLGYPMVWPIYILGVVASTEDEQATVLGQLETIKGKIQSPLLQKVIYFLRLLYASRKRHSMSSLRDVLTYVIEQYPILVAS